MKKTFVILFSFLLAGFSAQTQVVSEENIGGLLDLDILEESSIMSNHASIIQVGNENEIISIQQQEGILSNTIIVGQSGNQNLGYVKQIGSEHSIKLTQQGYGNEANLWSIGDKTGTAVYQNGTNNIINSYIDNQGFIPKGAILLQKGNYNNIEIALLGNGFLQKSWPKAAYIEQKGNDLQISVKLDYYRSPIYIEQQSGPSGGGMKIDISNSAFSFPMK